MPITKATIHSLASGQSYERGEDYYHMGAVDEIQKRGNLLMAEVEGSSYEPYQVTIELGEDQVISSHCTCPYDWGGACKHIVAVLLAYVHQPEQVTERPTLDALLADLDAPKLRELLVDLLASEPRLIGWVETKVAVQSAVPAAPAETAVTEATTVPPPPIDPAPFRRQSKQILRSPSGYDYYAAAAGVAHQISQLLDQAEPYLEQGDGRNALLILEAVTEPYVDQWYEFDDSDGELGTVFAEIGSRFAEAILSADLSAQERQTWSKKLTAWQGEIDDYGVDVGFDVAIAAAEQGWDFPSLQRVLAGHITDQGAWEGETPWYADELAVARLNVLERQGRFTEYLYLAEAEGQTALYLTMLVKLDRIAEAVEYAMNYMAMTDEALILAQTLRSHDHPAEALKIAEHGLNLQGETLILARWLRDFATELFQLEVALKAARAAFARSFALEDYQAAQAIAGPEWSAVKAELLGQLADTGFAYGKIDIYLHEGLVDEAVKTIDKSSYYGYETLERVVEAAWQSHPDWVIRQCQKQAERIMDAGQSKYYHHAVRWVETARRAYLGADRAEEWRSYLENLINQHARKYSLRPRLEALRRVQ
jgi:uncharacterized Zn finger protein